ncbi:MAG: DUF4364 family protein [Clostridiales bacterium]|nr:DUF4364 family protein [Clostridiales bacterium]
MNNLKINTDNETLAENKVLILYILDQTHKPITNDNLYKLVLTAVDMNYFYFQQFLLDLISTKFIMSYKKETQIIYELTDLGKKTLDLTLDILPGIIKLKVDTNLKNTLEYVEEEHSIIAEYIPKNENNYLINCKIIENNETVFEVKTYAYSREQAKEIVDNWRDSAEKIYPKILELLHNNSINTNKTKQVN